MIGRALVVGGAGFVGSHLVDRLADEGTAVLVIDDLSTGHLDRLAEARRVGKVQFHQMEMAAPQLAEAITRFDPQTVFLLAAPLAGDALPLRESFERYVDPAAGLLAAALETGAERVVVAVSGEIYGSPGTTPVSERAGRHPVTVAGATAEAVEALCAYYGRTARLDFAVLVLADVYGPRQSSLGPAGLVRVLAEQMLAGEKRIVAADPGRTLDLVYVDDAVDAIVHAADRGGRRTLNVSSGVETTVGDLVDHLVRLAAFRGRVVGVGGDPAPFSLDWAAAARHLEWEPYTPLREGLEHTVAWVARQ